VRQRDRFEFAYCRVFFSAEHGRVLAGDEVFEAPTDPAD
jgi:hypothetical protein